MSSELLGPVYFYNGPELSVWAAEGEVSLVERLPGRTHRVIFSTEPVAARLLAKQIADAAECAQNMKTRGAICLCT